MKLLLESWKSYLHEMAQMQADVDSEGKQVVGLEFKKVAEICRSIGDKPLLTRGFQATSSAGSHYITTEGTIEKGRMSKRYQEDPIFRSFIEKLVEKYNLTSLVYCATKGGRFVKMFGTEYVVFPTQVNNIIYSDEVKDSGVWIGDPSRNRIKRTPEEIQKGVDSYIEGFPPIGHKPEEVILDTPAYYLINLEWASGIFQSLAVRKSMAGWQQPPSPKEPVMSSRQQERERIMKLYNINPAATKTYGASKANYKDEMMAAKTYSDLAPYFEWLWNVSKYGKENK